MISLAMISNLSPFPHFSAPQLFLRNKRTERRRIPGWTQFIITACLRAPEILRSIFSRVGRRCGTSFAAALEMTLVRCFILTLWNSDLSTNLKHAFFIELASPRSIIKGDTAIWFRFPWYYFTMLVGKGIQADGILCSNCSASTNGNSWNYRIRTWPCSFENGRTLQVIILSTTD